MYKGTGLFKGKVVGNIGGMNDWHQLVSQYERY